MGHLTFTQVEELARSAHAGQVGPDGSPFVDHPLRVARAVERATGDETAVVVAMLHDSIEKGGLSSEELRTAGIGGEALLAIEALTQRPGEDVAVYLDRCRANPIARQVKRFDLLDKIQPEQLGRMSADEAARGARSARVKLAELESRPVRAP